MNRIDALYTLEHQFQAIEGIARADCVDERYLLIKLPDSTAVIFLIDEPLSSRALQNALKHNTLHAIHSLFVLTEDLLPPDGSQAVLTPYLSILQTLYHQQLYGYRIQQGQVIIFPVQLRSDGSHTSKEVVYQSHVELTDFTCGYIETGYPLRGFWATAYFAPSVEWEPPDLSQPRQQTVTQIQSRGVMKAHYDLLGVPYDADIDRIKQAYRQLARQYHPDYNPNPNANDQMQAINQAYKELIKKFE
ncbi:MAG: J domain-containing protein [Anaerolineales bacterium]|nr:J domain-containing protein [Anaerolineales bacterium]